MYLGVLVVVLGVLVGILGTYNFNIATIFHSFRPTKVEDKILQCLHEFVKCRLIKYTFGESTFQNKTYGMCG